MKLRRFDQFLLLCIFVLGLCLPLFGEIPEIINHQGRVTVSGVNFDGTGDFKFALVDAAGTSTFWSHDGTSAGGGEPVGSISLTVDKGLYSVGLGNGASPFFMDNIPASIFEENSEVFLRIWFREGANPFEQLSPDQQITSVGFALVAQEVLDPGVTTVFVSPVEGGTEADNGQALRDALDSISSNGPSSPFLVKIEPGIYDLVGSVLSMKDSVDIEGSGIGVTTLSFTSSGIFSADNSELRSLTVDVEFSPSGGIAIWNNGSTSASIREVAVKGSGGAGPTATGIFNQNGEWEIKDTTVSIVTASNNRQGIRHVGANAVTVVERVEIDIEDFGVGVSVEADGAVLRNVDVRAGPISSVGVKVSNGIGLSIYNSRLEGSLASMTTGDASDVINLESCQIIGSILGTGTVKPANCVDENFDPLVEFDSSFIADNAITNAKLATDAVTGDKIDGGAVAVVDLDTTDVDLRYVNQDGDTMAGSLDMGGNSITGVGPNVTATGPLSVSATGGSNDLSLDSDNNIEINALSGSINLNSSGSTINLKANTTVTGTLGVSGGNITGTLNGTADNAETLDGFDSSEFASAAANTVTVGPVGSDVANGLALINALAGIFDNGPSNPYVLKIEPGNYQLSESLQMKNDVDIEGSGIGVTRIISVPPSGGAVQTADNAELRSLSLLADFSSTSGGIAVVNSVPNFASITNVSIVMVGNGGGPLTGIFNLVGDLDVSNSIIRLDDPSGFLNGIRHFGVNAKTNLSRVKVILKNGDANSQAVAAENDGMELNNVDVQSDQGSALVVSGALLKVFNTRVNAPTAVNAFSGGEIMAESSQIVGTVSGAMKFVNCFDGNFDPIGVIAGHSHTTIFNESFVVEGALAAEETTFAGPGIQNSIPSETDNHFMVCTGTGTITNLLVHAEVSGGFLDITVRKNQGDTSLTTFLTGGATDASFPGSVGVVAGDLISVGLSTADAFSDVSVTLEFTYDSSAPVTP